MAAKRANEKQLAEQESHLLLFRSQLSWYAIPLQELHNDQAQAIEVAIAVNVLNRMIDLERPESVRIG